MTNFGLRRRQGERVTIMRSEIVQSDSANLSVHRADSLPSIPYSAWDLAPLLLIYMNAWSIVNKLSEMQELVYRKKPGVVAITETCLHSDISDTVLGLTGYKVFIKNRIIRNDHREGALLALKSTLNSVLEVNESDNEVVVVNLTIGSYAVKFLKIYGSPLQTIPENTSLIEFIESKISNHTGVIVFGDFNYPHINWD